MEVDRYAAEVHRDLTDLVANVRCPVAVELVGTCRDEYVQRLPELGGDDEMLLLELTARSEEAEFERVLLGLHDGVLLMMAMEEH